MNSVTVSATKDYYYWSIGDTVQGTASAGTAQLMASFDVGAKIYTDESWTVGALPANNEGGLKGLLGIILPNKDRANAIALSLNTNQPSVFYVLYDSRAPNAVAEPSLLKAGYKLLPDINIPVKGRLPRRVDWTQFTGSSCQGMANGDDFERTLQESKEACMLNSACLCVMCPTGTITKCTLRAMTTVVSFAAEDYYKWTEVFGCNNERTESPGAGYAIASSVWSGEAIGVGHGRGQLDSPQGWSAQSNNLNQWWRMDAGAEKSIVGVITQGRADCDQRVTNFKVSTSLDGTTWTAVDGGKVFPGNNDRNTKLTNKFISPVTARYVRIEPTAWNQHVSMRSGILALTCNAKDPLVFSAGTFGNVDQGAAYTDAQFAQSKWFYRQCSSCPVSHAYIYYKRITPIPAGFSMYNNMVITWSSTNNAMNVDFKLYSTYDDMMNGKNAWTSCNYNDPGIGFPRDCGPSSLVGGTWTSKTRGGQSNYAYYVGAPPNDIMSETFLVYKSEVQPAGLVSLGPITGGTAGLVILVARAIAVEKVSFSKGGVKLVGDMTYDALESQLRDDPSGASVCGPGFHVCNAQETTIYGTRQKENLSGSKGWIVGSYAGEGMRSIWGDQKKEAPRCSKWRGPRWIGTELSYTGDVACEHRSVKSRVACCGNLPDKKVFSVKKGPKMNYIKLNKELDRMSNGLTVCGANWHVCNFAEATQYGAQEGHVWDSPKVWIVGQFSDWEPHRRSAWDGNDRTLCSGSKYPVWLNKQGSYRGVVSCNSEREELPVACCTNRQQRAAIDSASVLKLVGKRNYLDMEKLLDGDEGRGQKICGEDWHLCDWSEAVVYGSFSHIRLKEHAWIVGSFSNTDKNRRSIWNNDENGACRAHNAPMWMASTSAYFGTVNCKSKRHVAPAACCKNSGFPKALTGELNMGPLSWMTSNSGGTGISSVLQITDLSVSTMWQFANSFVGSAWVSFNVGTPIELIKLIIYNGKTSGLGATSVSGVRKFKLEGAQADGVVYRYILGSELKNTGANPTAQEFQFTPSVGQYWKLTVLSTYGGATGNTALSQVELIKEGIGSILDQFSRVNAVDAAALVTPLSSKDNTVSLECAVSCMDNAACKSFVYFQGKCSLYSLTTGSLPPIDLVAKTDAIYYEKSNLENVGGYCQQDGSDYRGTISKTIENLNCQSWLAQSPQKHMFTEANNPGTGLGDHNYCRNPNKDPKGPWCLTTVPTVVKSYCNITRLTGSSCTSIATNAGGGGGSGKLEPSLSISSRTSGASIRVENRGNYPKDVFIELRNQLKDRAWGIGMTQSQDLKFCYGQIGTMNKARCAMTVKPDGTVIIHKLATFAKGAKFIAAEKEVAEVETAALLQESILNSSPRSSSSSSIRMDMTLPIQMESPLSDETDNSKASVDNKAFGGSLGEATSTTEPPKLPLKEYGGSGAQSPAATWWSTDDDVSLRVESLADNYQNVFYELRNANQENAWAIGTGADNILRIAYGPRGQPVTDRRTAIEISPTGTVAFRGNVFFEQQPKGLQKSAYIGCFRDSGTRAISTYAYGGDSLTLELCMSKCQGYKFLGLQNSNQCFCGNDETASTGYSRYGEAPNECNQQCRGNSKQQCGSGWRNSVYYVIAPEVTVETESAAQYLSRTTPTVNLVQCAATMTFTTSTANEMLCGKADGTTQITYTGTACGEGSQNKVLWKSMKSTNIRTGSAWLTEANCRWSSAGQTDAWINTNTGTCGVAPTAVPDLPTTCTVPVMVSNQRESERTLGEISSEREEREATGGGDPTNPREAEEIKTLHEIVLAKVKVQKEKVHMETELKSLRAATRITKKALLNKAITKMYSRGNGRSERRLLSTEDTHLNAEEVTDLGAAELGPVGPGRFNVLETQSMMAYGSLEGL